ncbi:30S ribosomal protein S15 [Candidatus Saccharibacteria bacterium RIFCSPHIGHO2_12_FULL_47_16b]|nr:MAG: 30S ribosomal protein S15 [Candidatus Saccharibacteria bacterium RIFCSPHIGHO2_12_FULL_47_16b]OGL39002.1 MAG: 30S ribosomal protein S15 [Candidatus Saccharibacteria bacterium RIFCSPLOWO2_02_FULL_46_7]
MITSEKKAEIAKDLRKGKTDTGSPAVQVGIMTERIHELTQHLKTHKHDFASRRALLQLVGKRKKLLKYISNQSEEAYLELIKKLGIRR